MAMYDELETQVLGGICLRVGELTHFLDLGLEPKHFLIPEHKEIFQKIVDVLAEKGEVEVTDFASTEEEWEEVFELMDNCVLVTMDGPVRKLIESYNEYQLKIEISQILENDYNTLDSKVESIIKKVNNLESGKKEKNKVFDMGDLAKIWLDFS